MIQGFTKRDQLLLLVFNISYVSVRRMIFLLTFFLPFLSWAQVYTGTIGDPLTLGQFRDAKGIAVDAASGDIYVGDAATNTITKFNSSGTPLFTWGSPGSGNGQFNFGSNTNFTADYVGFAVDNVGNLFVADIYNNRIQKFNSAGVFISSFGSSGTGNGQFDRPTGIAFDSGGNLYVAEKGNKRVQKFNSAGTFISTWGTSGTLDGQFGSSGASGLAIDGSDNIWVADGSNSRIQKFSTAGTFLSKFGAAGSGSADGQFNTGYGVLGLAIDAANNIYVTDPLNDRVQKFDATGTFLTKWGTAGNSAGQFTFPVTIAFSGTNIFVVEGSSAGSYFDNNRVQKFSTAGAFISTFGSSPTNNGQFFVHRAGNNVGFGVANDALGNVYVTDLQNNRVQKFNSSGVFVSTWGSLGAGNGQFTLPMGIAIDGSGNVFVSERGNRVQKFNSSGTFILTFGSGGTGNGQFSSPEGIAVDASGNVYVADSQNNRIQKFDNTGTFISTFGTSGSGDGQFSNPTSVAVDAVGNIYVYDQFNGRVQKFDNTGTFLLKWSAGGYGIAIDASGKILVTDGSNLVNVFTNTGTLLTSFGSAGSGNGQFNTTRGISYDAFTNSIYVADFGNNRVQRFLNCTPPVGGNDTNSVCSGVALSYSLNNNITTLGNGLIAGTNYSWVAASNPNVSGESTTPQSNNLINDVLTNTTAGSQNVIYTVTPDNSGCPGNTFTVSITVFAQPVGGNENVNICSGGNFFYNLQTNINVLGNSLSSTFTLTSVLYNGVTGGTTTPGPATDINEASLVNTSPNPVVVTYTVVPTSIAGCSGAPFTVSATVKPTPDLAITNSSPSISSGATTNIALSNPNGVAGTTFSWTVSAPLISGASSGSGSSISQTLINSSGSAQTAQYTITPSANGCAGTPQLTSVNVASGATLTVTTADSLALVTLYSVTNGATWTNKTNWLTGPVNTWYGVSVTGSRVSSLNLSTNNLAGPLPGEIGDLTGLTSLQLNNNLLSGSIPIEIGNLTSLTILNLASCQFSGNVPTQLTNLTLLTQLNLNTNQLVNLPNLTSLSALTAFDISNNQFEFDDIEPNTSISGIDYSPQTDITSATQSFILTIGSPLTINPTIPGTANSFQWQKEFVNVAGATLATFSIPSVVGSDAGSYSVDVTNSQAPGLTLSYYYFNVDIKVESLFNWITSGPVVSDGADQSNYAGSWGDYDNDGDEDLLVPHYFDDTLPTYLYQNNGDGTFTKIVSGALPSYTSASRYSSWGDADNDGKIDLVIGGNPASVFLNQGGGVFNQVAKPNGPSAGVMWGDYDNDGKLDILYSEMNTIRIENANGTVTDLGASNGIGSTHFIDFDNDNDLDVFQGGASNGTGARKLFQNNGNGTFTELTSNIIAQAPLGNRGGAWFDFDNDGDLDLFSSNQGATTANGRIFVNNGGTNFTSKTFAEVIGEDINSRASTFGDIDNDGDQDFIAFRLGASNEQPSVYSNNGNGTFSLIPSTTQTFKGTDSFASFSLADFDNNGFLDLFVGNTQTVDTGDGRGNGLYQNIGNSNHWLKVKLKGTVSNRSGIGARVKAYAGGQLQYRQLTPLSGWASPSSLNLHFGLGANTTVDSLRIFWPSGIQQVLTNVASNALLTVTETNVDSLALVALYNSTNGTGWNNKTNWLAGPINTWYGITIINSRVTNVVLSNNNLTGTLPAQLSDLTELVQLDLLNNKLTGTFPLQVTGLTKLTGLYLGNSQLNGTLPPQLGNLTELQGLGLDGNQFTGPIPVEMGNLTKLTYLGLSNNQLSGAVPTTFNNLDLLQDLYMGSNNLTDLPDLTGMAGINLMDVAFNLLTFEDVQPNVAIPGFNYCCQKNVAVGGPVNVVLGSALNLSAVVGGTGNSYQWYKSFSPIAGETANALSVAAVLSSSAGIYYLQITNPGAPNLTLRTTDFVVTVTSLNASEESGYTFVKKIGAEALGFFQYSPKELAVGPLGNIYVHDRYVNRICKFDNLGNLLFSYPLTNTMFATGGNGDMSVDAADALYITSEGSSNVLKYNASGNFVYEIPNTNGTYGNAVAPDGSLLFLPRNGPAPYIVRRHNSTTGAFIESITLTGGPNAAIYLDLETDASGNIYASDPNGVPYNFPRIDKYSSTGVFINSFDLQAAGMNSWEGWHFAVASNGDVYIQARAESGFGVKTYHFNSAGTFLGTFATDLTGTYDVAVTPAGILVGNDKFGLSLYDPSGGFIQNIGPQKNANGQFNDAVGIARNSKGHRFVVDKGNNRIQKFNSQGNWLSTFGGSGSANGQFNKPGSVAIDKFDNLFVTDEANNRVQKFSSSGAHLLSFGSAGSGNGQFNGPVDIAISKTGDLIVGDNGNSRVQLFKTDGSFVSSFGSNGTGQGQFSSIQNIVVESDGSILVADGTMRIQRFTPQGVYVNEINLSGAVNYLFRIATDADGALYIPTFDALKKFDKVGGLLSKIGIPLSDTFADGELRSLTVSANTAGDTLWIADANPTNRISIFTSNFRKASLSDSLALVDLYNSTNGASWTTKANWLTGAVNTWYGVNMSGGKIRKLDLQNNNLDGPLPASLTSLDNLLTLNFNNNKLTGTLPDWSAASSLIDVDLSQNLLTGAAQTLPAQTEKLDLSDNQLTDVPTLPPYIIGADLSNNKLTQLGNLPPTYPNLDTLLVQNNKLAFEDLEPNMSIPAFSYVPQDTVSTYETYLRQLGESQTFTSGIGGTANSYQWKKGGTDIPETNADLTLANVTFNDDATYTFTATNSLVPGLTLSSAKKILRVSSLKRDSIALRTMFNTTDGPNWTNKTNWLTTPLGTGNWFGITIANNRVTQVNLPNNNLKGPIAAIVADIQNLVSLNLSNNQITSLPDLTSYPSISALNVSNNKLDFSSLEQNAAIAGINYANQADLGTPLNALVDVGAPVKLKLIIGGTTNAYQWKRNGVAVAGATDSTYQIASIGRSNMGDYICEVTNSKVPGLILKSTLQRAKAVANITGKLQVDASTPVTKGIMTLLKINPPGVKYDTTQTKALNTDGTFTLQKVVLDDYLLLGQADSILYKEYFPTYFDGSVFWEEADTIKLNENRNDVTYSIVPLPTAVPKGVGELSGIFETELPSGRIDNRGRVAGASCTVRRQQVVGRPDWSSRTMANDVIVAFTYTNENGEFNFENLEEGPYLLNLQYPGVPMDPKSDIVITIGPKDKRQNVQQVSALAIGGKIVVKRLVIVGVSEVEQETVQIYPNPTSSDLYINLTEGSGAAEMKLFDRTGREILTQFLPEGKSTLDLSQLSAGIYLIKTYRHGKEISAARVMVE